MRFILFFKSVRGYLNKKKNLLRVNKYYPEVKLTSMAIKDNGGAHTLVELDISLTDRFHGAPMYPD